MKDIRIQPMSQLIANNRVVLAHVNVTDIKKGYEVIYFGTKLDEFPQKKRLELVTESEETCEKRISHETMHIVLYRLEGFNTTVQLDSFEKEYELSFPGEA